MHDLLFAQLWLLGSLIVWLILEMWGQMHNSRTDGNVDGTAKEGLAIMLWPILLACCAFGGVCWLIAVGITKASNIKF